MSVEFLTYGALGAHLNISPAAARALARRLQLPRSLSEDGKALVCVDLAEIRHTPHAARRQSGDDALLTAQGCGPGGADRAARNQRRRSPRRFRARTRARRTPDDRAAAHDRRNHGGQGGGGGLGNGGAAGGRGGLLRTRALTVTARSTRRNAGWGNSPRPWWNPTARPRVDSSFRLFIPPRRGAIVRQQ